MIYVASPYSHERGDVRHLRYLAVLEYTHGLIRQGIPAFSPIAYGYFFEVFCGANGNYESWRIFNDEMLPRCSSMHVLMLPGYDFSRGVRHEIDLATEIGLPTTFVKYSGNVNL